MKDIDKIETLELLRQKQLKQLKNASNLYEKPKKENYKWWHFLKRLFKKN